MARSDSPHTFVAGARHDGVAIWADGHGIHVTRVTLHRALALAGRQVPHVMPCGKVSEAKLVIDLKRIESARSHSPDGLVAGARHYGLAIRTHGYADDLSGVPFECALAFARGKVPHAGRVGRFRRKEISHHYETKKLAQATHRTVLSSEPDTMVVPSSLTATLNTFPV